MKDLVLEGRGEMTLSVDRGCLILELRKISKQTRVIPITRISCVELSPPQDGHRGYFYFRTPVANKPIKSSITGRDVASDDDMIFFDDEESYQVALAIKEYIIDYVSK